MTRRRGREASEKTSGIREDERTGDGATGRSVKTFQLGDIGNA